MNSPMYNLNSNDFIKGAITAVFAGVLFAVVGFVQQPDFNVFTTDWSIILSSSVNAAVSAFVGYLGKNLFTDRSGKVFGVIG